MNLYLGRKVRSECIQGYRLGEEKIFNELIRAAPWACLNLRQQRLETPHVKPEDGCPSSFIHRIKTEHGQMEGFHGGSR